MRRPVFTAPRLALTLAAALAFQISCGGETEDAALQPPIARSEPAEEITPASAPARSRGLWVLAEGSQRVLERPERIPTLVEDAQQLGATDLFVQVYRGGRAWFDSSWADSAPFREVAASSGLDPLAQLIESAHEAGLRVHAWVNVLSLAENRNAPLVSELGRDAVLSDRFGRSILDYPGLDVPLPDRNYYRMGTPAVWIDPAAPGVSERLRETFAELVSRYPTLDGLHLDYIRYPDVLPFVPGSRFGVGLDFGYGPKTRERFYAETGVEAPIGDSIRNANRWDHWRRERVTEVVRNIRDGAQAARQNSTSRALQLSAAVWTYADRAYLSIGQDWRRWIEDGLVDFAVPMAYTLDDRVLRYQAESFAGSPIGDRVWIGLGTWLFSRNPARAIAQIAIARAAGAPGDALFSYDAIADAPALREALIRAVHDGA